MDSERITRNEDNFQEDFLFQLFQSEPSVSNHLGQNGSSENPVQYPSNYSENNVINGNCLDIKEQNGHNFMNGLVNGENSLHKEFTIENKNAKMQENGHLEQNTILQNQIIGYEMKTAQLMQEVFSAKTERDHLKEQSECQRKELEESAIQINQLKAQIYQLTQLKLSQDETDNRVDDLQKKLALADKSEKKWKKQKEKDNSQIKKLRLHNRKQWNIITRLGQKLAEKGLLTNKEKACITKEYDEENPPVSEDFEFDDLTEETSQLAESKVPKLIEQPQVINETKNSKEDLTFLQPQAGPSHDEFSRKSSQTPQNASTLNRAHSFKHPHYFTKTCHDVLDDPLVSDEMDLSGSELSAMKKQLGLDNGHFTPISPIPPTPSPNSKQYPVSNTPYQSRNSFDNQLIVKRPSNPLETSKNKESQRSQMDSKKSIKSEFGRRLTFTHQQSEGFDVEGDSLNNVDRMNEDEPQNALTSLEDLDISSQRSSYTQRIQAKRMSDGNVKFTFNMFSNEIDFEVNYDPHETIQNISCVLPSNNHMLHQQSPSIVNQLPTPSIVNQLQRPTPSSSRIQKPVFIKKEPIDEDDSPPLKKTRIAPDVEPFRLSTFSSKDSVSSGFVSYIKSCAASNEKSGQTFCNDAKDQLNNPSFEGNKNSGDLNLFNNTESPFQTSTPVAFTFDTMKTSNVTSPDHSKLSNKPTITDKTGQNVCAMSTSCIDPSSNQFNDVNILSGEHNSSLQTQTKHELPRERSFVESTTPNSVINIPTPVQSVDNIHSNNNDAVNKTGRFDNKHTGYTSSESDQLESNKKFDSVNESLRRRRKKMVNAKESLNDAQFIRTRGRKRQSFTSSKKALDNCSESDTNNEERIIRSDSCKNPSELIDMDKSPKKLNVQDQSNQVLPKEINADIKAAGEYIVNTQEKYEKKIEGLSESTKFQMPQAVSSIMQTKPDISVFLVSNTLPKNDILTSPAATENRNGLEKIDNNDMGNKSIKNGLFVECMTKETNNNEKLSTHTNLSENSNAAEEQLTTTKTLNGDVLCEDKCIDLESSSINKIEPKFKNNATVSDNILVYPDVLHHRSISVAEPCIQKENTSKIQSEIKANNKKMPKRRTRSSYRNNNETVANMTCTDTDYSDLEQEKEVKCLRRKQRSKINDLQNNNASKQILPNCVQDISNCKTKTPGQLTAVTQSTSVQNSSLLQNKTSCTFAQLENVHHSTESNFSHINLGTSIDVGEHTDLHFPVSDNCITNVVNNDSNSPELTLNSSKLSENSIKIKTVFDSPSKNDTQNFKEIDLNQMVDDPHSLFNEISILPISNVESCENVVPEEQNLKDLTMKHQNPNKQMMIAVQSMPLSSDPQDNVENDFISSPASPDPKSPVTTITVKGDDTSSNTYPTYVDHKADESSTLVEVEVKTSPKVTRRTRSKSLMVENPTEVTSSESANVNCCVAINNDTISEIDSDNDSPLIIVEDIEDTESPDASNSQETSKMSVSPRSTNLPVRKSKRLRKQGNSASRKKKKQQLSPRKKASSDFNKIEEAFQMVEKTKYTDANSKKAMHNLVSVLLDPVHSPDAKTLIFLFVEHLYKTNRNPMMAYAISEDVSTLLHVTENILVSALFQIESKGKVRFPNLLNSVIITLYNLVLGKEERFPMFGLSALCRVLTQICKKRKNKIEPLKLCGELLQFNHRFAPYLIASVIGVWPEAFKLSDPSVEEETPFFSTIALGIQKKELFSLSPTQWKHCEAIFTKFLPAPALQTKDIPRITSWITQTIRSKCLESAYDKDYFLTISLLILSQVKGWHWAKEVLIETFLRPSIKKCNMHDELNEIGFEFLLNLCAEILYNAPEGEKTYQLIAKYFQPGREDDDFVHMTAGICIFKLHLWKHIAFSDELSDFIGKWHEHERFRKVSSLLIRRSMHDRDFERGDIIEYMPL
ncbi:hypothetical protein JTE90_028702 [Oedothorax gibbosus]|uniref:Uncharacterized protein n=1 Tax=Oedothorax gibbosus TaxID=931172 RepID=A0AAV6U3K6_9ARAC|nr:hypothetical protein JTE90_028702 [Oedothorax gibbosus]